MTREQAIAYLQERHAFVQQINSTLFNTMENGKPQLYRYHCGRLEKRIDIDVHRMKWEGIA